MTKYITFKKLSDRWFADIPYNGNVADLEMVLGADKLIEFICNESSAFTDKVTVQFNTKESTNYILKLVKDPSKNEMSEGMTYIVFSTNSDIVHIDTIWLCDVVLQVFGEFPEEIYINY